MDKLNNITKTRGEDLTDEMLERINEAPVVVSVTSENKVEISFRIEEGRASFECPDPEEARNLAYMLLNAAKEVDPGN